MASRGLASDQDMQVITETEGVVRRTWVEPTDTAG